MMTITRRTIGFTKQTLVVLAITLQLQVVANLSIIIKSGIFFKKLGWIAVKVMDYTHLALKIGVYGTLAYFTVTHFHTLSWLLMNIIDMHDISLLMEFAGMFAVATALLKPYKKWKKISVFIKKQVLA
jgi:hypothetical protein